MHRAEAGADRGGQREDVGFGAGGDDRAGVAQDDVGQERGLEHPGRGHDQQVLFQRDPQPVPVVGPAEEDGVLAGVGDPVPQRQRGADPAGAAQGGQAAPAQPQAEDVGEAFAGVQPQVQPDAQVPGAVAGQVAGGQERPRERGGEQDHHEQGDGVLGDHEGSPLRADRTALRRAARAAPVFRSAAGARAALIRGDAIQGNGGEWPVPFGDQRKEPGGLGRLPRDRPPRPGRAGPEPAAGWRGGRGRPGIPRAPRRGTRPGWKPEPGAGAAATRPRRRRSPAGWPFQRRCAAVSCWWRVRTTVIRVSLARA